MFARLSYVIRTSQNRMYRASEYRMNSAAPDDDQGEAHERALGHVRALVRGVTPVLPDLDGSEDGERDARQREHDADDQPSLLAFTWIRPATSGPRSRT